MDPHYVVGYCTFPHRNSSYGEDGCTMVKESLPGGKDPYGKGKVASHEGGHWFYL